jgi:hypothetical protein
MPRPAAAALARSCACCCTAASAKASTWKMSMEECMASERPILTIPGARLPPEPHHTPVLARRMMSSSMAALLCAHTSTRTRGATPSFKADCADCAGRDVPAPAATAEPCLPAAAAPRPLAALPCARLPPR